jgi:predicted RNA-binding protein with EMAP domain
MSRKYTKIFRKKRVLRQTKKKKQIAGIKKNKITEKIKSLYKYPLKIVNKTFSKYYKPENLTDTPENLTESVKSIEDIISLPTTDNTFKRKIINYELPFSIKNVVIEISPEKNYLGRGNEKTGLRVLIKSGIDTVTEAALIITDKSFINKMNYEKKFKNIITNYEITKDTGITPKLYEYFFCDSGYVLLLELVSGEKLCNITLNESQQIMLLNAYLTMSKLNLIQADPNCYNIYYTIDLKIKIIDDLSNIEEKYLKNENIKLFTNLFTLFNLQSIEKYALYTFLYNYINANKQYDIENEFDNISFGIMPVLEDSLNIKFETEIQNFISSTHK